jgi:CheY-like chemotaxis protein
MPYTLVVDDEPDGRNALCVFLRKSGYEVDCAANGREALSCVLARTPDVLILDLLMPEMDGDALLDVLRSYLRLQALPVIVLTGLPDSSKVEQARHKKVNTILVKGKATFDDILAAIQQELPQLPP